MSTLKQQVLSLQEQLDLSKQSADAKHIIHECQAIYERLEEPSRRLSVLLQKYYVVKGLPEDAPQQIKASESWISQIESSAYNLDKFNCRWREEGYRSRSSDELANSEAGLVKLLDVLESDLVSCWKAWIEHLDSRVGIEDVLLEQQKNIPGMEAVYGSYVSALREFNNLSKTIPQTSYVIAKLQDLCEQMLSLKQKMDWDLDEEVVIFLDHLDGKNNGQVPLSLLTDKVISWLKDHSLLDDFIVQRRSKRFL